MTLNNLKLKNFRNYENCHIELDPNTNVFFGENAQGKTNLLEAAVCISTGKGFRSKNDRELILFGKDAARIEASATVNNRETNIEIDIPRNARKKIVVNGISRAPSKLSELPGIVLFCPEELFLIKAGAAERRNYLNNSISRIRPRYAAALKEYSKLHNHKMHILRNYDEKPSLLDTLDDFNIRMASVGAIIVRYRAYFTKEAAKIASRFQSEFSKNSEKLEIYYKTVSTVKDPLADERTIFQEIMEHQQNHKDAELASRSCLTGPHRDDLEIFINGRAARSFASQSQARTAALSLKLAEREMYYRSEGEYPILLLDDVLSELDERRREFVLKRIEEGQVIITSCDKKENFTENCKIFKISGGTVLEE